MALNERGFSALDLLVALAIGAMLLSMGVPSFTSFVRNAQQVNASNELLAALHHARDLAITRNARVRVCASSSGLDCDSAEWAQGWVVFVDEDGNGAVGAGETIDRVGEDLGDVDVGSAEFGGFLVYRPSGRIMVDSVTENNGEFTLCDERGAAHARVVIVDISGRPRVAATKSDGSAPSCPGDA